MASNSKIQLDNSIKLLANTNHNNLDIAKEDVYVDKTFDLKKFNDRYNDIRRKRRLNIDKLEKDKLSKLGTIDYSKKIHQLTIGEIAFNFKDSMFDTLTDLLNFRFNLNNNRLFYLGLLIIIIIIILYLLSPSDCGNVETYRTQDLLNKIIHNIQSLNNI